MRIYLVYQVDNKKHIEVQSSQLEELVKQVTRGWSDTFADQALQSLGEADGLAIGRRFKGAFPSAYRELYAPDEALAHIELFDGLEDAAELAIDLRHQHQAENNDLQLALFHRDVPLELSDMIPMLENLGFRVVMEHPYLIQPDNEHQLWMQEFNL